MGIYGGGSQSYKPDKNIGKAALENAALGRDYLGWMQDRAKTTDAWAAADRRRSVQTFRPLEDAYIRDARTHDSSGNLRKAASEARADVLGAARVAREGDAREMAAMGVNPNSGRYRSITRSGNMRTALAASGAANLSRNRVRSEADAMKANAINLGQGLAVNPLSAFSTGNSALASGVTAAQQGNNSVIQAYSNIDQNKIAQNAANAQATGSLFEGLGTLAGFALMSSDENLKTDKEPAREALPALRKLDIKSWRYKPGVEDGGASKHTGAMAQDWQKATGAGDGRTINAVDAIGVTMQAVQEVDKKLDRIARGISRKRKAA